MSLLPINYLKSNYGIKAACSRVTNLPFGFDKVSPHLFTDRLINVHVFGRVFGNPEITSVVHVSRNSLKNRLKNLFVVKRENSPRMPKCLFSSEAFGGVFFHHVPNEVFGC